MDFDEEARKLFKKLETEKEKEIPNEISNNDLSKDGSNMKLLSQHEEGIGIIPVKTSPLSSRYNALDEIYKDHITKQSLYVGNQSAASSIEILAENNIRYIVNCTHGPSKIPNFFERKTINNKRVHYFEFPISHWSMLIQNSSHESILSFVLGLFEFIELAWSKKSNVLIHCLAGAHRAGTTGCLCLMHYAKLQPMKAKELAKQCRPVIDPIGMLPELLNRYDMARNESHQYRDYFPIRIDERKLKKQQAQQQSHENNNKYSTASLTTTATEVA